MTRTATDGQMGWRQDGRKFGQVTEFDIGASWRNIINKIYLFSHEAHLRYVHSARRTAHQCTSVLNVTHASRYDADTGRTAFNYDPENGVIIARL